MNAYDTDVAIIGAGPAGMAAAAELSARGVTATVLDEQAAPGGQIYRAVDLVARERPRTARLLGNDYLHGRSLTAAFPGSLVAYRPDATVWQVEGDGTVGYSEVGRAKLIRARFVLVATGALERPVPVPGWTLPGVMTAGAAQLALKSADLVPDGRVVLAGTGPLLLLVAGQLADAGARVAAVLETTRLSDYLAAAPFLPRALIASEYLKKGLAMRARLRRAGVPVIGGVRDLAIEGEASARAVTYVRHGRAARIEADLVLLHVGVVPNTQITRQAGCAHDWHSVQRCWRPQSDEWGRSSVETLFVAGDGAAIDGARAAECSGRLAALEIAHALGRVAKDTRDAAARPIRRTFAYHTAPRRLLDALTRPPQAVISPVQDDVLVCRCEEVTLGALRQAIALGCLGPNQLKSYARPGMGPCQGRMCGLTVAEVIAAHRGVAVSDVGYFRIRPPIKPLTIGELAALDGAGAD
jgi:NADPH-dependent 2,4-dienoyl-CoA reductase/sulfur reductase-like enzyme